MRVVRAVVTAVALMVGVQPGAGAQVDPHQFTAIAASGPLSAYGVQADTRCAGFADPEPFSVDPQFGGGPMCGTFLAVGPQVFLAHVPEIGFGPPDPNRVTWTPAGPQTTAGTGTAADPARVQTVVDAGTTGLRITETDATVLDDPGAVETVLHVENRSRRTRTPIVYRGFGCFADHRAFGIMDRGIGCDSDVEGDRGPARIRLVPGTAGAHVEEGPSAPDTVFAGEVPHDTCVCGRTISEPIVLAGWPLTIRPGQAVDVRSRLEFTGPFPARDNLRCHAVGRRFHGEVTAAANPADDPCVDDHGDGPAATASTSRFIDDGNGQVVLGAASSSMLGVPGLPVVEASSSVEMRDCFFAAAIPPCDSGPPVVSSAVRVGGVPIGLTPDLPATMTIGGTTLFFNEVIRSTDSSHVTVRAVRVEGGPLDGTVLAESAVNLRITPTCGPFCGGQARFL